MKRLAVWVTTVTTILVLGGQLLGQALPSLGSVGVFVGTNTPAARVLMAVTGETTPLLTGPMAPGAKIQPPAEPTSPPSEAIDTPVETAAPLAPSVAPVASVAPMAPACPASVPGVTGTAPARVAAGGLITGTTSEDLAAFANTFNAIRVANCLPPVPTTNFHYDSCMEDRLFWMAEDPSSDPTSAWGHLGSVRSDAAPSVGCDGNLAGGSDNSSATMASKWWDSLAHRASLYQPDFAGVIDAVCIHFAMARGGVPDEPNTFTRGAARFGTC